MGPFINFLIFVAIIASQWFIYKKMGHEGWEGIIPFYNLYVLFNDLEGSGWRFLTLLIPLYNIYVVFKIMIDWAHSFNKSTGFGVAMTFFPEICLPILAFTDAKYKDGAFENADADFVTDVFDGIKGTVDNAKSKDKGALDKLEKLYDLKEKGAITEEEYEEKKAELMSKM